MIQISRKFDCFLVNNNFVDKYMCEANGSFIKVYLYILRHAEKSNLEITDIANALNLLESDVIRAFKYWQKQGVIEYKQLSDKDFTLVFNDTLCDDEVDSSDEDMKTEDNVTKKQVSVPTAVSYSKSDINTYMKNNDGIRHMFLISEQLLCKTLTDTERKILFSFYDYLGMPIEVIFTLLEYCISIGKTNIRYIEKVAYSWADKGINTLSKASSYVKEENEINSTFKKYKALFKITGREFTSTEESLLKTWVYDMKLSDEDIVSAYETTVTNTGKIAFKYMDAILKNINQGGGKKPASNYQNKSVEKKNSFQDYDTELGEYELELIRKRLSNTELGEM